LKATLWGTRGSISSAGAKMMRFGGDTSSVEVLDTEGRALILDAGSGIRAIGEMAGHDRVDILLSHLHMDHVQGLPFFAPLLDPGKEVHIWGPISTTERLRHRLSKYLSPPLFPIHVRDLPNVAFHDVLPGEFDIGNMHIYADLICHPGSTMGYRLNEGGSTLTYMPDHEPALGVDDFPGKRAWTSGLALAERSDVLIHDSQYTDDEYQARVGWGHSSTTHLARFAEMAGPGRLVTFHHDPAHTDAMLDHQHEQLASTLAGIELIPGTVGLALDI
jgi:ribonuclease BN (tRNA processing enzyme)